MVTFKIHCPFHDEKTPSMVLYGDHGYCFGCGKYAKLEDLPNGSKILHKGREGNKFSKEDLNASITRIKALGTKIVRGLELPYDDLGYYVLYPNTDYYVRRLWKAGDGDKYRGPKGHRKPLFIPHYYDNRTVLLAVEGQLNALSVPKGSYTVVSPGGCSDLAKPEFIKFCLQFSKICAIVDKDASGVLAGTALVQKLHAAGKRATVYAMERDMNDIYVGEGEEGTRREVSRALELLGVQGLR